MLTNGVAVSSYCSSYGNRLRRKRKIEIREGTARDFIRAGLDFTETNFVGIVADHHSIIIGYAVLYWQTRISEESGELEDEAWLLSSIPLFMKDNPYVLAKFSKILLNTVFNVVDKIKVGQDAEEKSSQKFLEFLGFEKADYKLENTQVWIKKWDSTL